MAGKEAAAEKVTLEEEENGEEVVGRITTEGEDGDNGESSETKSPSQQVLDDEHLGSLCGKNGEWESRKISIMGVVKRFISQLSYGQDLTRFVLLPFIT